MTAEPEIAKRAVAARPDGIPPLKDFITFVPILATALAVFYDVGYFSGFDINYFSFFTLNEHIVFALEILPTAMLVCALSLPQVFWLFNPKSYENRPFHSGQAFMGGGPEQSFSRRLANAIKVWALAALSIGAALYAVYNLSEQYVLQIMALIVGVGGALYSLGTKQLVIYIVLGAAGPPLFAYAFGLQQADQAQHATASHIIRRDKEENSREGVLLRAGERGILFFDAATRQVTMIRWDGVTEVVTKKSLSAASKP
jgi:hypothetical protein